MKIVLDVDAVRPPLTGIGRYALELARGLVRDPRVSDVRFFTPGGWIDNIESRLATPVLGNAVRRRIPLRGLARRVHGRFRSWRFAEQVKGMGDYVYHSPNYSLFPFPGKSVVTFHDLSVILYPEFHPADRVKYLGAQLPLAARAADHILTDCEFIRRQVCEVMDVPPERVTSVPLGVDPVYRPMSTSQIAPVLAAHGLRHKGYVLIVSTVEPRKNFVRLLEAFRALPQDMRRQFPLAVCGGDGWRSDDIHLAVDALVQCGEAVRLGYVDEADLPSIYCGAAVFALPSLYEGFGLPVLEAMATGTAVLSSDCSSIPELAGDACLLVEPESVESIRDGLSRLLGDDALREHHQRAGPDQAAKFSWERCVTQTIDLYGRLA